MDLDIVIQDLTDFGLQVDLALAEDGPYTMNGTPVTDDAAVTVETVAPPTETPAEEPPMNETETPPPTEESPTNETAESPATESES